LSEPAADSLRLWLDVPAQVRAGAPVAVTVHVENISIRALDLYLRGRELTFDVVVTRADGSVVWRRLEGEVIPAILRVETLAPGRRISATAEWDQRTRSGERAGPGSYSVRAEILTDSPRPLETPPVGLRIETP
jgi:hypothetical protein